MGSTILGLILLTFWGLTILFMFLAYKAKEHHYLIAFSCFAAILAVSWLYYIPIILWVCIAIIIKIRWKHTI